MGGGGGCRWNDINCVSGKQVISMLKTEVSDMECGTKQCIRTCELQMECGPVYTWE